MNCSYDVVSTLRSQTKHHEPVILIELTSTKNTIVTDEICPTLTSRMGTGGNQVNAVLITEEMIVDVLPFDTTQITSDKNWSHPRYGDPCHPLANGQHPPTVVIRNDKE